jgi:YVTN family beta-propeller protein
MSTRTQGHPPGRAALAAAPLLLAGLLVTAAARADTPAATVTRDGVKVDLSVERLGGDAARPLREGDYVEVQFRITDVATGEPVAGQKPAAWLDLGAASLGAGGEQRECKDKVALYLKGVVGMRPMVDLNGSFVLVLNQDPSLSVIDPLVSLAGRTSLYTTVPLKRPPADWALDGESKRVYVSQPAAGEVAVVDTESFVALASLEAGKNPVRVALHPGRRLVFVGNDGPGPESGVTVLDPWGGRRLASLRTGRGHHELAFSVDGRRAFVTNRDSGTVSVVDVVTLRKERDLAAGPAPISLAVSPLSRALYVADGRTGEIVAFGGEGLRALGRVRARPGLGPMRSSQDGRWVLAVNPAEHAVYVVDAATNTLAHVIPVGGAPFQVTFTRAFAYVRLLDSARIVMVNLASLAGKEPIVQGFEAGTGAPRLAGDLSIADSVVPANLDAAVYAVNPADGTVSFYMEGMNAPMGSYGAYGHAPRALAVLDRSLQSRGPGRWGGRLRLPAAGRYDVAFLLDAPRLLHCFSVDVEEDPARRHELGPLAVDFLDTPSRAPAGAPLEVRFRLLDPATGKPRGGLAGVGLVSFLAPGLSRSEVAPRELSPGLYAASVPVPRPGAYYLHVVVPSLSVKPADLPFHSVIVEPPAGVR